MAAGRRERLETAVLDFFRAAEERDFDAFRAGFAPQAVIVQNGEPVALDDLVKWTEEGIRGVRYSHARRIVTDDAVVEQHTATVTLPNGQEFTPPEVCVVFRFDEAGRFVRVEEYAPLTAIPRG